MSWCYQSEKSERIRNVIHDLINTLNSVKKRSNKKTRDVKMKLYWKMKNSLSEEIICVFVGKSSVACAMRTFAFSASKWLNAWNADYYQCSRTKYSEKKDEEKLIADKPYAEIKLNGIH